MLRFSLILPATLFMLSSAAGGQQPKSLGQPSLWQAYVVPAAQRSAPGRWNALVSAGIHHPITNPVTGLLGVSGEVYTPSSEPEPGARLLATSRAFGLSAGIDWHRRGPIEGVVSFQTAILRGGLLGHGTMLRVDWLPGRGDQLNVGVHVPFAKYAGRTRPRSTDVDEPIGPDRRALESATLSPQAESAMQDVARAATMILAYTNLFDKDTSLVRYGESFSAATRSYRDAMEQAFRAASGRSDARTITTRARTGLLDFVILPYDSLFGRVKAHSSIRGLTATAHTRFLAWLHDSSDVAPLAMPAVAAVHARWMTTIEALQANLLAQWGDSRLVWLPLQLALTEDQYDEQAEVDGLVERAVGHPFTDRNDLAYLRSSDLPLEIARSILAAREYHVLWTHDFTGQRDETRTLDEVAYTLVADAYYPALIRAVQRYDSTRKMPSYNILLDEYYYEARNGRLWMDILEDPVWARVRLPGKNAVREAHLRQRQFELRRAMDSSRYITSDLIKVHVNIGQRADWSFRSHRVLPPLPFVPDHLMRDHRKLAFYDLNEADPYRGALIVMGIGIGEHYSSATWEDRGLRIRGPAALEARIALRQTLLRQGLKESEIPAPLQVRDCTGKNNTCEKQEVATFDYLGRALQLHNEVGFGPKESSVARAMLYNLAPAGSVIIVPDPIWVSETWAAMLAGAATRGARVFIIAPSKDNNPNPHGPIDVAEREVMLRLLQIRDRLAPQLKRTGGELRVGLYDSKTLATDAPNRLREIREGLKRAPWIRQVIPFDDQTLAVLDQAVVYTESDGRDATDIAHDEKPRAPMLHQKTQLIARPGAIQSVVRQPGWDRVLADAMRIQSRQSSDFAKQLGEIRPDVDAAATRGMDELLRAYEASIPESERKAFSFYFALGSQNQDPRGLMMDGEEVVLVSGLQAAVGLVDLYYMMARTAWVQDKGQLDALLPEPGGFSRLLTRVLRRAL